MKRLVIMLLLGLLLTGCASNQGYPRGYGGQSESQKACQIRSTGWGARYTNCNEYQ